MPQDIAEPQASTLTEIPEGFTVRVGPGGKEYLVPQYMIPALDQAFAAYHHKTDLNVLQTQPEFAQTADNPYIYLGQAKLIFPPDPQLSDQENLILHAEVVALQQKLGISYKDASHRLYMGELEKLKVADETHKAFKNLDKRITGLLEYHNENFGDDSSAVDTAAKSHHD